MIVHHVLASSIQTFPPRVSLFLASPSLEHSHLFVLANNSSKSFKNLGLVLSSLCKSSKLFHSDCKAFLCSQIIPIARAMLYCCCPFMSPINRPPGMSYLQVSCHTQPCFSRASTILAHGTWHSSKQFINISSYTLHNITWLLEEHINICSTNAYWVSSRCQIQFQALGIQKWTRHTHLWSLWVYNLLRQIDDKQINRSIISCGAVRRSIKKKKAR